MKAQASGKAGVPVHDVQLFALWRRVSEAVGMGLQRAGHLAALAAKRRANPHIWERVHTALQRNAAAG